MIVALSLGSSDFSYAPTVEMWYRRRRKERAVEGDSSKTGRGTGDPAALVCATRYPPDRAPSDKDRFRLGLAGTVLRWFRKWPASFPFVVSFACACKHHGLAHFLC